MFAFIQKWHKNFGIVSALFVIFLAASGIVLNHSQELGLNSNYIQAEWLLDLYQVSPEAEPVGYHSPHVWVTQVGARLYFNENEIANDVSELIGIVSINDIDVIAYDGQLTLLTHEGDVIEHLTGAVGVPAGMQAIGLDAQSNLIIKAAHGYYRVNLDDLDWEEFDHLDANWSESSSIPDELKKSLLIQYRGTGLIIERVILDFHSGRIVGQWGVYVVDLMAILFLIMAFTGVWMWWTRR